MQQVNGVIQIVTATLLGLVCILLAKHSKSSRHSWTGIGFTLCIFCYIIIESAAVQSVTALRIFAMLGAICIPVLFWFLSRSIFDDHFKFAPRMIGWSLVQLVPHFNFFILDLIPGTGFELVSQIIARAVSFGFVLAGLYTALKTKQSDLVDSRIKFRNAFIVVTAVLIGITLIVEVIPIEQHTITELQVLQRSSIFGLTLYFLISNFTIHEGFFFKEISKPKPQPIHDSLLSVKLQALMDEKKIYKKD